MRTVQNAVLVVSIALTAGLTPAIALAAETEDVTGEVHHYGYIFAMFMFILIAGRVMGASAELIGQPPVIGELASGIMISALGLAGWAFIDDIKLSGEMAFLSALGAALLLFAIGLESSLTDMRKVGGRAFVVACIGVIVPFALGTWVIGPVFFGNEEAEARLFMGAAMVATSVGITSSVFKALGLQRTVFAQTVLGAAVIDDVLGLIVLAVVSAMASGGDVSSLMVAELALKSFGFLAIAAIVGKKAANFLSAVFSRVSTEIGMKITLALSMALGGGYLAELLGLEAIIGAFAAGLILEDVHFKRFAEPHMVRELSSHEFEVPRDRDFVTALTRRHSHGHVEDLIGNWNIVLVPIFFVYTGMQIDVESLLKPELYLIAIVVSIAAIAGKLVSGVVGKGSVVEKALVGVSMVPRGEVGLIFAATGQSLGVLSSEMFSVIILMVIITTFISPPVIKYITSRPGVMASLAR